MTRLPKDRDILSNRNTRSKKKLKKTRKPDKSEVCEYVDCDTTVSSIEDTADLGNLIMFYDILIHSFSNTDYIKEGLVDVNSRW